ncbi:MAG TPA: TolC family protein [Vicinamibacterales bacterium]|jgi:outer membrane protein|nr:TolC family protein [Vicinamibacterales bacterium]
MNSKGTIWALIIATALLGVPLPAGAQQQISDARIRELIKEAAERAATGPTTLNIQAAAAGQGDTRPTISLTLDDAVKDALDHNLDIAVSRLNPEINDIGIAGIRTVYKPALTSQLATQSQTNPATSSIAGGATAGSPIQSGLTTFNGGVTQNLPWGGGGYVVSLTNTKTTSQSLVSQYNPLYQPIWTGQFTQPLMRGWRIDSTRQQLTVSKLNRDISDVQLRSTITNTLSNVRNAYWDYVYAIQAVDVAKQSVDLADQLVRDNQTRVEVGTMAPIDVITAQSQAATQRQNLVQVQANVRTAELALKRLIVSGTQDPLWDAKLDPVDRPDFRPEQIDIVAAVRRALSERTDLDIARKNVQQNDVTLKFLHDQTLPQADVVAQYGFVGIGGNQLIKQGTGVGGTTTITGSVPGGYGDSLSSLFNGGFPRWNVTMNISYPIGLSTAQASVARARIQLSQAEAQTKQIELQIATDVTNAALTAQSSVERVQAAQVARELAQKTMEAEQSKFEVGMSTNYNVILTQRDLATAQDNELQATLAYRKSLVELERLQQTTLTSLGITVLSTTGLTNTAVGSGRPTVVAGGS